MAFVAFSPLGHGWLVDDFRFNSPDDFAVDDFRRTGMLRYAFIGTSKSLVNKMLILLYEVPKFQGENFYKNKAIVDEIKKLATKKGCTIAQIALAWVAAQGLIAIPGTTKASRLVENWGSREVVLTKEEQEEMRKIVNEAKPTGNRYAPMFQALVGH